MLASITGPGPYKFIVASGILSNGAHVLGHSWDTTSGLHQAPPSSYSVSINDPTLTTTTTVTTTTAATTTTPTTTTTSSPGTVYFDGRAKNMTQLTSYETTPGNLSTLVQAQTPTTWSCLCFNNNDMQLSSDTRYGKVYATQAGPGSRNPWNTGAPTSYASAQVSKGRPSYDLGKTFWYAEGFKLASTWTQPDFVTLDTFGYATLSSGPIDIGVASVNGVLSYTLYMNSGLLTANSGGFYQGSQFGVTQIAPVNFGKWVDVVLGIKWATDNTGSVDVYTRVEGQTTWTHAIAKQNIPTEQYGTTSYGTVTANGLNTDGSLHSVLDKEGLYFGFWDSTKTSFPTQSLRQSGMTRSSDMATAMSTLP